MLREELSVLLHLSQKIQKDHLPEPFGPKQTQLNPSNPEFLHTPKTRHTKDLERSQFPARIDRIAGLGGDRRLRQKQAVDGEVDSLARNDSRKLGLLDLYPAAEVNSQGTGQGPEVQLARQCKAV